MSTNNTEPLEISSMQRRINLLEDEIQRRIVEKKEVCAALGIDWQNVVNLGQIVAARVAQTNSTASIFNSPEGADKLRRLKLPSIRSGSHALCLRCGFEGIVYGTPNLSGVSHPWCPRCESNMGLVAISKSERDDTTTSQQPPTPALAMLAWTYKFVKPYSVDGQVWFAEGQLVLVFDNTRAGILTIDNSQKAIVPLKFPPTGWDGICLNADSLIQYGYMVPDSTPAHQHASYVEFYKFIAAHREDLLGELQQPQDARRPITWNDR